VTWVFLGLGIVVVLGGAVVADAYYHAYKVYQTLQGVTPALTAARAQLAQGIVPTGDQLDVATGLAADAQSKVETAGFTFDLTGHIPFLNRPVVAARLAASAADKEANAATIVRSLVVDLLGPDAAASGTVGATPPPVFRNGVIDVGLISSLTPRLETLVANLRSADADIRAIPTIPFVKTETTLKQNALTQSAAAVSLAERALSGIRLLPSFLGADGPKTYYLALQNNADERGTGGAVLAYAMVRIDQGRISLLGAGRILDLDLKKGGINVAQPASVTWYTSVTQVAHRLANGENYSPNFPDVARTWAAQLLKRTGSPVNGVIALDPSGIASALKSERCFRVADYPSDICGTNVVSITENAQYHLPKPAQDVLAGELVQGAFASITNPTHFLSMVRNLSSALADKHVQLWSADPAQQALLTQLGWNGAIVNKGGGDYLNLAYEKRIGNKVDYYAQENVTYDVTVQPSGGITSTYHLLFENQTPPNQVQDIAGQARPYGVDIAMFNLYTPKQTRFGSVTPAGDFPPNVVTPSNFSDHVQPKGFLQHLEGTFHVFTQTVLAWPGNPGDLTFRYSVPGVIEHTPEGRVYTLTVQHQPMVRPMILTVHLTLPKDADVRSLPTGWSLLNDVATYHGTVSRDFVTQLVF